MLVSGLLSWGSQCAGQPVAEPAVEEASADTAADAATALEISLELERRQQAIDQARSELGLYDPSLVELYDDLARFYQEQGDHEQALALYKEAFQITRINTGLNSEQQLPYIDKVIQSSLAMNDWQQADDMHQLRYYLKNRLYDPADPRFAAAIAELGDWKLRVMRENLLAESYRAIGSEAEALSEIYREGIARIEASPSYREDTLLPLYRGKSHADLEVARVLAETPYQYFEGTVSEYVYETVCTSVRDAQGNLVRQCSNIRRLNPRYRESQQDSKRIAVNRSVREVQASLDTLTGILARNPGIPAGERERLTSEIREMQTEFLRIQRGTRRSLLF
jgi:tetratricopeptide (TPR) repeat protein